MHTTNKKKINFTSVSLRRHSGQLYANSDWCPSTITAGCHWKLEARSHNHISIMPSMRRGGTRKAGGGGGGLWSSWSKRRGSNNSKTRRASAGYSRKRRDYRHDDEHDDHGDENHDDDGAYQHFSPSDRYRLDARYIQSTEPQTLNLYI